MVVLALESSQAKRITSRVGLTSFAFGCCVLPHCVKFSLLSVLLSGVFDLDQIRCRPIALAPPPCGELSKLHTSGGTFSGLFVTETCTAVLRTSILYVYGFD